MMRKTEVEEKEDTRQLLVQPLYFARLVLRLKRLELGVERSW